MPNAKQTICITSSSDEDDEENNSYLGQENEEDSENEDSENEDSESEYSESESDQNGDEESDWSSTADDEYESVSEDQSDEVEGCDQKEGKAKDEDLCDKVVNLLRQRNKKLDVLKLDECKAYLRKHDLMISGTKATCIQRILEHWRLKDGNGETLYPKSSFTINCTGDVCKGDVVTFQQRVYDKFNKVSRNGKVIGKRTIAGRVVKESYGSAKQQHTFTVEVLWSRGVKPLPLLYPLLVKGRNLYKYRTFRQRWGNEAERSKVLEEKHRRGATARHVRASTKAIINAGSKRGRNLTTLHQKHQIKPPKKKKKHSDPPNPNKKHQKTSNSKPHLKNSFNYKHISISSSSSSNHSNTFKSKITPNKKRIQTDQSERKTNPLQFPTKKPNFPHIFHNSASDFHQRSKISTLQTGNERIFIPVYNYYSQNAIHGVQMMNGGRYIDHSRSVYASRFDRVADSGHTYSSSGHFFGPGACDQKYAGFQFHERSQFWP